MSSHDKIVGGPLSAAEAQPGFDVLDGFRAARASLENERKALTEARDDNDRVHVEKRNAIDKRLEAIRNELHGPRKTRTAKAKAST